MCRRAPCGRVMRLRPTARRARKGEPPEPPTQSPPGALDAVPVGDIHRVVAVAGALVGAADEGDIARHRAVGPGTALHLLRKGVEVLLGFGPARRQAQPLRPAQQLGVYRADDDLGGGARASEPARWPDDDQEHREEQAAAPEPDGRWRASSTTGSAASSTACPGSLCARTPSGSASARNSIQPNQEVHLGPGVGVVFAHHPRAPAIVIVPHGVPRTHSALLRPPSAASPPWHWPNSRSTRAAP